MPYPQADPGLLKMKPLADRKSKSDITKVAMDPDSPVPDHPELRAKLSQVAERILQARARGADVMMAFGAHLVKNGAGPILVRMMERGWITHLATQGAGSIHDWEFAFQRFSEEDVRANVATGTFGVWDETGRYLNLAVLVGATQQRGYGESIGAMIQQEGLQFPDQKELIASLATSELAKDKDNPSRLELLCAMEKFGLVPGFMAIPHPFKKYSIFANAFRLHIPITVHLGIGYDILYNNPYTNGAALGRASHTDFKIFVQSVSNLSGGVFLSIGSAIMAPQVFEKAMSFANNLKLQSHSKISDHLMVINDLQPMTWDWHTGEPPKSSPDYYLRFLKSFARMGGEMQYVAADNRAFLHQLYSILCEMTAK